MTPEKPESAVHEGTDFNVDSQRAPDPLRLRSHRHGRGKSVIAEDEVRKVLEALAEQNHKIMSRPLRSRIERGRTGARAPELDQEQAQEFSEPGEDAAEVVTDG